MLELGNEALHDQQTATTTASSAVNQQKMTNIAIDLVDADIYNAKGSPPYAKSGSIELKSENGDGCPSEVASSAASGSSKRMTRKERQERRSSVVEQARSNEENRLPAGIHQPPKPKLAKPRMSVKNPNGALKSAAVENKLKMQKSAPNSMKPPTHSFQKTETRDLNFDVMDDPDYPPEAVNSNIIVEEIEMNGRIQKIYKKTYYLIDGKTINITRMEQA